MSLRAPLLATTKILIADGYEIDCPSNFLDPGTQRIMELPMTVKDVKHEHHTFNAESLISHLSTEATLPASQLRAYVTHRDVMDENDELQSEDTIALTINKDIENNRRKFFKDLLKKDSAVLNDGKHPQALAKIQELANGIDPGKKNQLQRTAAENGIIMIGDDFRDVAYKSRSYHLLIGLAQELGQIQIGMESNNDELRNGAIHERNKRRMRAAAVGTSVATLAAVISMFTQDETDLDKVDFDTVVLPTIAAFLAATGIQGAIEHYTPSLFRHTRTVTGAALTAVATATAIFGTQYAFNQKDGVQPAEAKALATGMGAVAIPVASGVSYYANSIYNRWQRKNNPAANLAPRIEAVKTINGSRPATV